MTTQEDAKDLGGVEVESLPLPAEGTLRIGFATMDGTGGQYVAVAAVMTGPDGSMVAQTLSPFGALEQATELIRMAMAAVKATSELEEEWDEDSTKDAAEQLETDE